MTYRNTRSAALMFGAALSILSACASRQPDPLLATTQTRLDAAYANKDVAERSQSDLQSARQALATASEKWRSGDMAESNHQITLAQTYLATAETRGHQAEAERQIQGYKDQQHEGQMAAMQQAMQEQLRQYNLQQTQLGSMLVLQDVSFETGKADLKSGAVNKLQPLITFLQQNPQVRVRIEGNTDNTGSPAKNEALSQARAEAVAAVLADGGVDRSRIDTFGYGAGKPVADNNTPAGRLQNRRVELTILN